MGLNSVFDDRPEEYEQHRQCWLNDRREMFIVQKLLEYDLPEGAEVLELGSGTGWLLKRLAERFPELNFAGVDPIEAYVKFSRERNGARNIRYAVGTAEAVDRHLRGKASVILSNDVLHHVGSLDEAALSVSRAAVLGCKWLAIEPNCKHPYAFTAQWLRKDERNFWPGQFAKSAKAAGWSIEEQRYLFLIPTFVGSPPEWLKRVERGLESVPFLGGGVCLEMRLTAEASSTDSVDDVSAGGEHAPVFVR